MIQFAFSIERNDNFFFGNAPHPLTFARSSCHQLQVSERMIETRMEAVTHDDMRESFIDREVERKVHIGEVFVGIERVNAHATFRFLRNEPERIEIAEGMVRCDRTLYKRCIPCIDRDDRIEHEILENKIETFIADADALASVAVEVSAD